MEDVLKLVHLYQSALPIPTPEISRHLKNIDFEYLATDLPRLFASMENGAERITDIVRSLRNFSRLDEAQMKLANIHEGLDNTLLILQHRLLSKNIEVVKQYGDLPDITCYPAQLNQVFMNILTNAIDALMQKNQRRSQIIIKTERIPKNNVYICIQDNGMGISSENLPKIFDPFFTTKPVGQGTGMGLSICYQIIQQHHGEIKVDSELGVGTIFEIILRT